MPHDHLAHLKHLDDLLDQQRIPLVTLRLAAYSTDAMRVLNLMQQHAAVSPDIDKAFRSACPDWKNPGAVHDPCELITIVLTHLADVMQHLGREARLVVEDLRRRIELECLAKGTGSPAQ